MLKRPVVIAATLILTALGTGIGAAEPYPARPVTMVVPFAAGGPTDVLARIVAQSISQTLGQQIVIENVTGAGGSIAAARVAKAAPDGYTMILGNLGTHAASVALYKNLPYDPRVDFEPVVLVATTPMVLLVRKSLPVDTLKSLIAYAKEHPRKVSFGSAGTGSVSHLTYLLFTHLTETEIQHVPYRGSSQVSNDLLAGQIDMTFEQAISASAYIASRAVKPLAVTASTRAAAIPAVPSTTEAGLPDLQTTAWTALFVPKATPQQIVERINASVDKAMREETSAKRMAELGADLPPPDQRTPQALGALVRNEIDKWVPLIKAAGAVGE